MKLSEIFGSTNRSCLGALAILPFQCNGFTYVCLHSQRDRTCFIIAKDKIVFESNPFLCSKEVGTKFTAYFSSLLHGNEEIKTMVGFLLIFCSTYSWA